MKEVGHLGPAATQKAFLLNLRKKRAEIYKRFHCSLSMNYLPPLLQLPVWLLAVEAIRKMCGKEVGLLGTIFGSSDSATAGTKELSFATEGALWFPDLLVPDPMLLLPFMLSATMLGNLYHTTGNNLTAGRRRMVNALKFMALCIGPITLQFPSAILVYWISSSSFAMMQAAVLERLMPVKPPVVPCKPRNKASVSKDMKEIQI